MGRSAMALSVLGSLSMTPTSYPLLIRVLTSTLPICPEPPVTITMFILYALM